MNHCAFSGMFSKTIFLRTGFCLITMWLMLNGCNKIEPGTFSVVEKEPVEPTHTATARLVIADQYVEAVGTVRPKTETHIEARITGQVLDVKINSGDPVKKGDLLISLDSRQMVSRLDQARQALKTAEAGREQSRHAVDAARAGFKQAQANYNRYKGYFDSQAATAQELEAAESSYRQAEAGLKRAKEGLTAAEAGIRQAQAVVEESQISLEFTRILAPEDGVVLKRLVEPGDLALPGKPLVTLRTTGALRLEANVREGLISQVKPGTVLDVAIGTLSQQVAATIEEIVPYADPASRTFLVKAALPPLDNLYPGMFGKLRIPVDRQQIVVVPLAAVRRVGQLELLQVKTENGWQTRFIKTGVQRGDQVEVLTGLDGVETIGWEVVDNG